MASQRYLISATYWAYITLAIFVGIMWLVVIALAPATKSVHHLAYWEDLFATYPFAALPFVLLWIWVLYFVASAIVVWIRPKELGGVLAQVDVNKTGAAQHLWLQSPAADFA